MSGFATRALKTATAALVLGAFAGLPVLAQQTRTAAQVSLTQDNPPAGVAVLGPVRAEIHQKSMFPKSSNRELADAELKAQAAKMGADAVVQVKYDSNSAMLSKKGFLATGVAVRFTGSPTTTLAAAAPQAPAALPQAVAPAPALAAAVHSGPTPTAAIAISTDDLYGGRYQRLGELKAEAHQSALFAKKSARDLLDESLRAQAARLGADAVVLVKYDMNSGMFSKKASTAVGVAVRTGAPPLNVAGAPTFPQPVPVAPPIPAGASTLPPALPAAATVPAVRSGPTPAMAISLSQEDLYAGQYRRLGEIKAEAHQTALFAKKSARDLLDESLREKAARMGADAVVQIKYDMNSGMFSKKASTAVGVAVAFGAAPAPARAPTLAAAPAPGVAASPTVAAAAPAGAPVPTYSAVMIEGVLLSEGDATRPYAIVGQLNAAANQAPARDYLNQSLRAQAAALGADAVVQIKYDLLAPGASRPSHASGVAVKYR